MVHQVMNGEQFVVESNEEEDTYHAEALSLTL